MHATYENKTLGTTRWLGKGLIYSLVRFSRIQNQQNAFGSDTEGKLASHLRETYAENLNNYITAKITTVDAYGKKVVMKVETGNVLNEASKDGKESIKKASAIFPRFLKNPKAYIRMIFKGMWVFPGFYYLASDTKAIKEKLEAGKQPSFSDRFKHAFDQTKMALANSYTSAALAVVKEAEAVPGKPETKVEAVMAAEFSPNQSVGGIRWVGLEGYGFLNPEHASFAATQLDTKKMQEKARKQLTEQKDPYLLWEGENYVWSDKQEKFVKSGNGKSQMTIDANYLDELLKLSPAQYDKAFKANLVKILQEMTYGKEAKGYSYNYIDTIDAFYSALGAHVVLHKAGGVKPSVPSKFSEIHKWLQKFGSKTVKDIDLEKPYTAPNFAAVNTDLVKNSSIFFKDGLTQILQDYKSNEFEERLLNYAPKRESFSPRLDQILANSMNQNFSIQNPQDQFPNRAEAYTDMYQYGQTVRNLKGSKLFSKFSMYATSGDQTAVKQTRNNDASSLVAKNNVSAENLEIKMQDAAWAKDMRVFLSDYGFDDKAEDVRLEIKKHPVHENPEARIQQLDNIRNFEGNMNTARELAILFFSRTKNRLSNNTQLNLINDLVAKALALQPKSEDLLLTAEQLAELGKMPKETEEDKEKLLEVRRRYLEPALKRSVEETTRKMTAEFLGVMYGDNVSYYLDHANDRLDEKDHKRLQARTQIQRDAKVIFGLMAQYVDRMYFDTQAGSTRWLGRALTTILCRLGEKAERNVHYLKTKPMLNLQKHLQTRSLDLEMFLGDKVVTLGGDNKFKKIKVNPGTGAGYMSNNAEAGAIAFGSQAGDKKRAKELGMTGTLLDSLSFIDEEKIIEEGFTSFKRFWKASNRGGFGSVLFGKSKIGNSHYGDVTLLGPSEFNFKPLKTDSKIQVAYIIDNFPNPVADSTESMVRPGGVRFTGPETFNDAAHDSHITISVVNHSKRGKILLDQINKKLADGTYLKAKGEIVFPAHKVVLDEKGNIKYPDKKADGSFVEPSSGWRIDEDLNEVVVKKREIESRINAARSEAEKNKLYSELSYWLQERATKQLYRMMSIGTFFKWVTPHGAYYDFSTYCSQMPNIAFMIANNLEIEIIPSDSPELKKKLARLGKYAEENIGTATGLKKEYLQNILDFGLVDTALKLSKLPIVYAPSSMLLQPYHDSKDIHRVQLVSSGLGNILNTTSNEVFVRNPVVLEKLNRFLVSENLQALKKIDPLDLVGVTEHYLHKRDMFNADRGVKNLHEAMKLKEDQRKTVVKKKFWESFRDRFRKNSSQKANSCPAVFKKAG